MSKTTDTDYNLPEFLSRTTNFNTADFFAQFPGTPAATVYSRIRQLVKRGTIQRIGRGKYTTGHTKAFSPIIDNNIIRTYNLITDVFPYSDTIIWPLSSVHGLLQHLIDMNMTIIDIDRDSVEALYWFLKGNGYHVVTRKRMIDDLSEYNGYLFIRPLVTSAPKIDINGIRSASLEKILVDLACDKEFKSFHGSEIIHIFENAFNEFTINTDRLLHYAGRKEKRAHIEDIIKQINRQ